MTPSGPPARSAFPTYDALVRSVSRWLPLLVLAMGGSAAAACGAADDAPDEPAPAAPARRVPMARTCTLPAGHSGKPETIEQAVALLNALPKPVTVACFLQVLDRPFHIDVSSGNFSLQPAFGPANPRIFVFSGQLVVSVVPKGQGAGVMELGVLREAGRTLKAEIPFPITADIPKAAPYERILHGEDGTSCGVCHENESRDWSIDFAKGYASRVIPPARENQIEPAYLEWVYQQCDPAQEPDRCAVLDAVFGPNDVVYQRLTR